MNTLRAVMWATSRWLQTDISHEKNKKTMYLINTIHLVGLFVLPGIGLELKRQIPPAASLLVGYTVRYGWIRLKIAGA
jgi:hypothetical protein